MPLRITRFRMSQSAMLRNVRANWPSRVLHQGKRISSFDDEELCSRNSDTQKIMNLTENVLNDVVGKVADKNEITFRFLIDWIPNFLEVQLEMMNVMVNNIMDGGAHETVLKLVKKHLDISEANRNLNQELLKCIKNLKENHMKVNDAINLLMPKDNQPTESDHERQWALHDLNEFVTVDMSFSEDFMRKFQDLLVQIVELQKELEKEEKRLDRKFNRVKSWIKVSSVIFAVTCCAILVCTALIVAFALPACIPVLPEISKDLPGFDSIREWFSSLWKKYETKVQERRDVIHEANAKTLGVVKKLEEMKRLIENLPSPAEFHVTQLAGCDIGNPSFLQQQVVLEKLSEENALFCEHLDELETQVTLSGRKIQEKKSELLWLMAGQHAA